jgi:hypothetical protein
MIEYARHEFRLARPGKDGKSLRETLETVERMTRRRPAELDNPGELSPLVAHVWVWFTELAMGRQSGFGPLPITWQEVESYARQFGLRMQQWELRALRLLDRVALTSISGADDGR